MLQNTQEYYLLEKHHRLDVLHLKGEVMWGNVVLVLGARLKLENRQQGEVGAQKGDEAGESKMLNASIVLALCCRMQRCDSRESGETCEMLPIPGYPVQMDLQ